MEKPHWRHSVPCQRRRESGPIGGTRLYPLGDRPGGRGLHDVYGAEFPHPRGMWVRGIRTLSPWRAGEVHRCCGRRTIGGRAPLHAGETLRGFAARPAFSITLHRGDSWNSQGVHRTLNSSFNEFASCGRYDMTRAMRPPEPILSTRRMLLADIRSPLRPERAGGLCTSGRSRSRRGPCPVEVVRHQVIPGASNPGFRVS